MGDDEPSQYDPLERRSGGAHLTYVPRQPTKVESAFGSEGLGYVHVKVHQLFILSFAWIETNDEVAGKPLDREAVRNQARPIPSTRRKNANALGIRERLGLDNVDRHTLDRRKRAKTGAKYVIREVLETAKLKRGRRRIRILDGGEDAF
jgi:hypothetical protein